MSIGGRINRVDYFDFCATISLNVDESLKWTSMSNFIIPSGTVIFYAKTLDESRPCHLSAYRIVNIKGDGLCTARSLYLSLNPTKIFSIPRDIEGNPLSIADQEAEQNGMNTQMQK